MLRKITSLNGLSMALVSILLAGAACAEEPTDPASPALPYVPYGNLKNASDADIAKAKEDAAHIVQDMLHAYDTKKTPEMMRAGAQLQRKADAIADATISAERDKVMEFLGIDPTADSGLYFFVSWSMPLELLQSYAIEAMWSGGTLVFKGVPPGKTLGAFLTKDLKNLVYGKGAAANISMDPRLFDAYGITTVPAVVFTTVRDNLQCQGITPVPVKVGNKTGSYNVCPALDPATYWKLSGAVTSSYALQAFIDDGARQATPYMRALSRGWAGQTAPGKAQKPFTGEWKDALSPSENMAVREAVKVMTVPSKP